MTTHTLTLAHSPDSDDLVMWWPLTGLLGPDGKPIEGDASPAVDGDGFTFACTAQDVETLNKRAIAAANLAERAGQVPEAAYDITAISCHTYPHIKDSYQITASGGSFGEDYGPKVVVKAERADEANDWIASKGKDTGKWRVAVPGVNTTAFLTLSLMFGSTEGEPAFDVIELPFEEIAGAVTSGNADAGLLIHEAQLTFQEMGLIAIADVGNWWHTETGMPLSLGLNVIRRDLDDRFGPGSCKRVADVLAASIKYCVDRGDLSRKYLIAHSDGRPEWRDPALVDKYLAMYVSDRTLDMGQQGRDAIAQLLGRGHQAGLCPDPGVIDAI